MASRGGASPLPRSSTRSLLGSSSLALPGHTRGHAAVAVDAGVGWLLHAGDAFYHPGAIDGRSKMPLAIRAHETIAAFDLRRVRDNHARLAELYRRAEPDLRIVCAHDPTLFEQARAGTPG